MTPQDTLENKVARSLVCADRVEVESDHRAGVTLLTFYAPVDTAVPVEPWTITLVYEQHHKLLWQIERAVSRAGAWAFGPFVDRASVSIDDLLRALFIMARPRAHVAAPAAGTSSSPSGRIGEMRPAGEGDIIMRGGFFR